ncbi:RagB/SusD family nutrient uptake outer membrane protein [Mucilaginibacter sp. SMC90]|uniref:RagB/SusD family nutrient uptake outer membrane protein n=1 Tax=Mucilaginibacter sp. SMC90 TaxID=2929803 RepID=UPI001FB2E8A6|nr:RagB/SusD family nutrient uptake outer membrane protein [Mucilaginibacter sp. SMC90]UOE50519.1 RagB/SusD family nutrient uptake outer membrane protein [Mucilaginibacter sp. SMC90]
MKNSTKYMHKAIALGLIASFISFQSCKKSFLNVDPAQNTAATLFFKTQDDATKAVSAMYANLREWNNIAFAPIAVESMGSDDVEKGSTASDATFFNDYHNFTITSGDAQLGGFWKGQYQNINFANQILTNVPGITMDETLKARYLAEAKFIRAYSYFRLVRAFGDVPLRLTLPKDASEYNLPRTAKEQVWAAIETDLTDAANVLPQTYSSADVGHATKGAALALHAKVAMYLKKWSDVLSYTNQVMGFGYSLYPDYEQLFRTTHKNNQESVFEIQCSLIPNNPDASNSQYSQVQGVRGVTGGGWGFNVPSPELAAAYETGDPRRDATIIFRGETTPEGDKIPATGDNPMYNQKSYVPFSMYVSGFNEGCQQNKIVLRYADVLLMNAEANNELGSSAAALIPLEQVRARARAGNNAILPKITTTDQAALRTAIYNERRVELAMEFERYFDVIRQGRGTAVFGSRGWKAGKNEVWPVPQNEIDLSGGALTQNPGY